MTGGRLTGGGDPVPVEITRLTDVPGLTGAPANGLCEITLPAGTVALVADVMLPTVSPAPTTAVVAAPCVKPTTFGADMLETMTARVGDPVAPRSSVTVKVRV